MRLMQLIEDPASDSGKPKVSAASMHQRSARSYDRGFVHLNRVIGIAGAAVFLIVVMLNGANTITAQEDDFTLAPADVAFHSIESGPVAAATNETDATTLQVSRSTSEANENTITKIDFASLAAMIKPVDIKPDERMPFDEQRPLEAQAVIEDIGKVATRF